MPWERIATLEQKVQNAAEDLSEIQTDLKTIKSEVQQINSKLDRQKGFVAGMLFILTPVWVAIVAFAKSAWEYVTQGGAG